MVKVLIWKVSKDTRFRDNALKILESQHEGFEIVGETSNDDIAKIDIRGGIMMCSSASAKNDWA